MGHVKFTLQEVTKAQRGRVANATPRTLYPREWPGTHCIWGRVGPRVVLDCVKSIRHRDSNPAPSSRYTGDGTGSSNKRFVFVGFDLVPETRNASWGLQYSLSDSPRQCQDSPSNKATISSFRILSIPLVTNHLPSDHSLPSARQPSR